MSALRAAWDWYRGEGLDLATSLFQCLCGIAFLATVLAVTQGWDPWASFALLTVAVALLAGLVAGGAVLGERIRKGRE